MAGCTLRSSAIADRSGSDVKRNYVSRTEKSGYNRPYLDHVEQGMVTHVYLLLNRWFGIFFLLAPVFGVKFPGHTNHRG